jgi:hypothetical protein
VTIALPPPAQHESTHLRRKEIPFTPTRRGSAVSDDFDVVTRSERRILASFGTVASFELPAEYQFEALAAKWKEDTRFESSPYRMAAHRCYQKIIGMGQAAVPLLLRELRTAPDLWFEALRAITGEQPVKKSHAGDIDAMARDWLEWGERNGYDA